MYAAHTTCTNVAHCENTHTHPRRSHHYLSCKLRQDKGCPVDVRVVILKVHSLHLLLGELLDRLPEVCVLQEGEQGKPGLSAHSVMRKGGCPDPQASSVSSGAFQGWEHRSGAGRLDVAHGELSGAPGTNVHQNVFSRVLAGAI